MSNARRLGLGRRIRRWASGGWKYGVIGRVIGLHSSSAHVEGGCWCQRSK